MPKNAREEAKNEQQALERGKALPHYAKKVTKELADKPKHGKVTPSKRG